MALITSGFVHHHQVAKVSLESNLLKWSVKQYYLKALLCELVLCACVAALDPGGVTILNSNALIHPALIPYLKALLCELVLCVCVMAYSCNPCGQSPLQL